MEPTEIIKMHLQFLIDEYGFSVARERYTPETMGNAEVVFTSELIGIKVIIDRSQVLINIGRLTTPEDEWFELSDVVHYYAPSIEDVYAFPKDLRNQQKAVESQIDRLSWILHQHCEKLLKGDFSDEAQIRKVEQKRVEKMLEHFNKLSEEKKQTDR